MRALIRFCAGRPVMMTMILGALILGGGLSFLSLPLDRLPELAYPRVTVETLYPGMGAQDIRSMVTIPLEDALSSVKGLQRIRSVSRDDASVTVLDFRWGADPAAASVLVREAIDAVYPALPEGTGKPSVIPGESGEEPLVIAAVSSRTGSAGFERNLAEYELRARFRRLDGTGSVVLVGGENSEARIRLDLPRAFSRSIFPAEFARIIASETADVPAGNIREGDLDLAVVSTGRPGSLEELSRLIVPAPAGPLSISDVSVLNREPARWKSLFIAGGREQVALEIYRRPGTNPAALSREIRKTLDEAAELFSRDAELSLVYDASASIVQGIKDLGLSALCSAAAVALILFFFIRRFRYSLLAVLSIPLSAATALVVLALTGRSLNTMSLGGLAMGIGLVSDTAVIVLDLLCRRFDAAPVRPGPVELGDCVATVSGSSMASTLTTAVVFIPIVFLPGPLGALFGDLSIALVASITAGWLYAQLVLPVLYRVWYRSGRLHRSAGEGIYRRLLRYTLRRPLPLILGASLLSAGGLVLLAGRPAGFVSPDRAAEIVVSLRFPPGTDLEILGQKGAEAARILESLPGISSVFGRAGAEDEDIGRRADADYRREELRLRCLLDRGADGEAVLEAVRRAAGEFAGEAEFGAAFPRDRTEALLGLSGALTLAVRGNGREEAESRAETAAEEIARLADSALGSLTLRPLGKRPELRIRPDRESAALLGLSSARMAETVRAATEGLVAARLEIGGRPLDVRVSGDIAADGSSPEGVLKAIPLSAGAEGTPVFLGTVGRVERGEAPTALARLDRADVVYLDALPAPGGASALGRIMEELQRRPELSRTDESAFSRYRSSLWALVFLVLALLYLTMGAQFESFLLPAVFMLSIPLALAGTGPALILTGQRLDSGSVLGLVVLFGLVVNNGIVLYERAEEKTVSGLPAVQAAYAGGAERFRPVLATTLTTLFALLPLLIAPLGASQRSMAAAMLGGVSASTLLTLFVLPPVFIPFLKRLKRRNHEPALA
jgi:multidrug efflux pump subunit AcrB